MASCRGWPRYARHLARAATPPPEPCLPSKMLPSSRPFAAETTASVRQPRKRRPPIARRMVSALDRDPGSRRPFVPQFRKECADVDHCRSARPPSSRTLRPTRKIPVRPKSRSRSSPSGCRTSPSTSRPTARTITRVVVSLNMVSTRRRLLDYVKKVHEARYKTLIERLGIRR